MTELDHLPRHEIGDVDPDVPLRQIRRLCNRRRYLRDELVLTLGGAACADLAVDKDLMAFQWTAADEVAIECDLSENDLCKVGRSARCLAVDARDFGGDLCPLGGIQAAFDGNDGVVGMGFPSLSAGFLIACYNHAAFDARSRPRNRSCERESAIE